MCPSLLDVNFRHNFRTLLFYLTFGCHFRTSHLEFTFWTGMLGKTVCLSRVKLRLLPGSRMARHTDIATYGLNQPWVRFVKIHKKHISKNLWKFKEEKKKSILGEILLIGYALWPEVLILHYFRCQGEGCTLGVTDTKMDGWKNERKILVQYRMLIYFVLYCINWI